MDLAPRNAIILARLPDLRHDDERRVEGQVQDGCGYARRISWGIGPRLHRSNWRRIWLTTAGQRALLMCYV